MRYLILLLALAAGQAQAQGLNLRPETWGKDSTRDYTYLLIGLAAPLVAHEAGHQLVGGGDIRWHGTEWHCVRPCNARNIAAGGFISEISFAESSNRFIENQSFKNGTNLSTSLHLFAYALRSGGDMENFSPRTSNFFRTILVASSTYFFFKIEF